MKINHKTHTLLFYSLVIFTMLFSCKHKKGEKLTLDYNFDIIIQTGQSTKLDLRNSTYIVYYSKNSLEESNDTVKFNLSASEYQAIKSEFLDKSLNNIPDSTFIEDKCLIMPKVLTKIVVQYPHKKLVFWIDYSCPKFTFADRKDAKKIIAFLNFVNKIIQAKEEIKNTPTSNAMYI
ncbi:MAG: hypothetical protein QM727_15085 [Niabella sp.]